MRAKGTDGARPSKLPDRELWRRSQVNEATLDEAERFLDLAAFADNRLDDDETERVAALIARDADAAADVAAARALAKTVPIADEILIARAAALIESGPIALVIAFPRRQAAPIPWYAAASWSSLAAAVVLAGWFGFDLGSGISGFPPPLGRADGATASELLDPAPPLVRDFVEGWQT